MFYLIVLLSVCALNTIIWHLTELIIDIRIFIKTIIGDDYEEETNGLDKDQ